MICITPCSLSNVSYMLLLRTYLSLHYIKCSRSPLIRCHLRISCRRHRTRLSLGACAGAWTIRLSPPFSRRDPHPTTSTPRHHGLRHLAPTSLKMAGPKRNRVRTDAKPPVSSSSDRDATVDDTPSASSGAPGPYAAYEQSEQSENAHMREDVSRLSADLAPMHIGNDTRE